MSTEVARILGDAQHRSTPVPSRPWLMFQSWQQLLFMHWPVPADELRRLVPPELTLEEHSGSAWVGVTPFLMRGVRFRGLPPIPGIDEFPETNLRTYVRVGDVPGIFFFSLEAASRLAVFGARTFYRLPYQLARMATDEEGGWFRYRSRRPGGRAELALRYRPVGPSFRAGPGTLEHFLTERYALYVVLRNRSVVRGDVQHGPWELQPAEAEITRNALPEAEGIRLPDRPPLLHFSARQDTVIWAPRVVG